MDINSEHDFSYTFHLEPHCISPIEEKYINTFMKS